MVPHQLQVGSTPALPKDTAKNIAELLLQTHGRMGAMAIAICILQDIVPEMDSVLEIEDRWVGRFT